MIASLRYILLLLVTLACAGVSNAQESYNALPWRMSTAYNAYLLRDVHQQYAERQKKFQAALLSKKALTAYRESCKYRYRQLLGDLPEKTDLHARVVGVSQQKGYRVEKVVYESVPHRYVTANFYIPDGKGSFPTTLVLAGHGIAGKLSDQKTATAFVLNGIAALAVDPVAQGERLQLTDDAGKPLTRGATTAHTLLNAGANLVGTSVAAYEYWDNVRALDYLETRAEVDKDKLACIGSSGGGTQTTYLIGLDDRIKVASVCSYVSQRERTLELSGASDGCQHIPYEGREQLEISDFLLMFAPKPLLIMSGYYDMVDYWGASHVYAELKQAYGTLSQSSKVSMFSLEGGHGMPRQKREAAVTWFRTWLCSDKTPVKEQDVASLYDEDILCTTTGQVATTFPYKVTIQQHNYTLSKQYASSREAFMKKDSSVISRKVLELLGISLPANQIEIEQTGASSARNYKLLKYQIIRHGQMPVPCLVLSPETAKPDSKLVLYLNESGKSEIMANEKVLESYLNQDDILVLSDLRGFGETTDPLELNDPKYWNKEYRNAMISLHTGKTLMGQRVVDIMSLLDFIRSEPELKKHTVKVVANGAYGPAVIHAAYLDRRIAEAEISRSVKSFEEMVQNPMQKDAFSNVLYGVLKYYDLKDLVVKAGNKRIRFTD
ncbi:alpha/beta hydrolase family protein [Pontibacter silvestris]|uniref:Alpha/beta hydrolase family protein n=1 Tax=Pontibacter silvestris TaxID=2305183 RepID=A0ABW4WZQ3_9BACT|nr:acetylxylan esterase [Pontibacter silvestris]MCC9135569.1 alpha/beta hydrolase family protein [Pontibacter silvestris]